MYSDVQATRNRRITSSEGDVHTGSKTAVKGVTLKRISEEEAELEHCREVIKRYERTGKATPHEVVARMYGLR